MLSKNGLGSITSSCMFHSHSSPALDLLNTVVDIRRQPEDQAQAQQHPMNLYMPASSTMHMNELAATDKGQVQCFQASRFSEQDLQQFLHKYVLRLLQAPLAAHPAKRNQVLGKELVVVKNAALETNCTASSSVKAECLPPDFQLQCTNLISPNLLGQ